KANFGDSDPNVTQSWVTYCALTARHQQSANASFTGSVRKVADAARSSVVFFIIGNLRHQAKNMPPGLWPTPPRSPSAHCCPDAPDRKKHLPNAYTPAAKHARWKPPARRDGGKSLR